MCQAITVPVSPANSCRRIWLKAGPAFGPWVAESLIVIGAALAISVGPSWLRYVVYGSAKQTFGHSQHRRLLAPPRSTGDRAALTALPPPFAGLANRPASLPARDGLGSWPENRRRAEASGPGPPAGT